MRILVPFTPIDPKTRLGSVLDQPERRAFAQAMLEDVVDVTRTAGYEPTILTPREIDMADVSLVIDERSLSSAVNAALRPPTAVVMADLPLLTPGVLESALEEPGEIVINPGRGGGTNFLLIRSSAFSVDYHGTSFADHRDRAESAGLSYSILDSYRLATDIDEPDDLVEVLLHSDGRTARWLRDHDFSLATTDGRVTITRE